MFGYTYDKRSSLFLKKCAKVLQQLTKEFHNEPLKRRLFAIEKF
jgi:hypothetical protein